MVSLWRVKHLETRRAVADYTSSEQGHRAVTQLVADGEVIANAIESTTWTQGSVQVVVCAQCGFEACAPGGWVAPRRAGSSVLWPPAFAEMRDDGDDAGEHRPPDYVRRRGIPRFDEPRAATLCASLPGAPDVAQLPPLRSDELALAMQWTAPGEILGAFPGPVVLRAPDVVAVSSGDRDACLRELAALLSRACSESAPATLRPWNEGDERIEIFLDTPGRPMWSPLARVGSVLRLHLDGVGVVD